VDLALNAGNHRQGFAEIHLRVARRVLQRYEHFPTMTLTLTDIVADDRSAAIKIMFVAQTLEYPLRRVTLLFRTILVLSQYLIDDANKGIELRTSAGFALPVTRRQRVIQHLGDRPPINAKMQGRLPFAHPVAMTGQPEVAYPFHDRDIPVTSCGRICMHRKKINISTVVTGQRLGIKEVDDGIWLVSFMHYDLGYIDLEQRTVQTIDNPFGPRLSPMS